MHYHPATVELLSQAARKARELGHSYVGSAHFLLALSREGGSTGLVLRQMGVNPELMEALIQLLYGLGTPELPLPQGLTPEAKHLLRGAAGEARSQRVRQIQPQHLLLAMARQERGAAGELLRLSGIGAEELFTQTVEYLRWEQSVMTRAKKEETRLRLLEQFSEDLVAKAATMDPVIGREREIDTVIGKKDENEPCVLTLVERMTRMCIWVKAQNHTSEAINDALQQVMSSFGEKRDQVFRPLPVTTAQSLRGFRFWKTAH